MKIDFNFNVVQFNKSFAIQVLPGECYGWMIRSRQNGHIVHISEAIHSISHEDECWTSMDAKFLARKWAKGRHHQSLRLMAGLLTPLPMWEESPWAEEVAA